MLFSTLRTFCFDFACLTRLAYVPALAMNLRSILMDYHARKYEFHLLLNVRNFLLLLMIRLHLVHFILLLRSHKCRIITGVVHHLIRNMSL